MNSNFLSKFFSVVFSAACLAASVSAEAQDSKVIGLRVDPGYIYDDFPSMPPADEVSAKIVSDAQTAGFNTIYVFAYSPTYGAFYNTSYTLSKVEAGYGRLDVVTSLINAAHARGMKVVAGFPVNNFKSVWQSKSAWRSKKKNGADYVPDADLYLLSAWHTEYRSWYRGLIRDFLVRHPGVDGVEALEGFVDYNWDNGADYNPVANQKYFASYPTGTLGDVNWQRHRASGLTGLHSIMIEEAHAKYKQAHVVQTWTAGETGSLFTSNSIRNGSGFDFSGIMNLSGTKHPDYLVGEFMWQQWAAEYGPGVYSPAWTSQAATAFINSVAGRTTPIFHIEISPFWGTRGYVEMTDEEFRETVVRAINSGVGIDIYDYHQLIERGLLKQFPLW